MKTSIIIDTDNDHASSHSDIKSFGACYILQHIIILVVVCLIAVIVEEEEEIVGKQVNSFEGWNLQLYRLVVRKAYSYI